ncbi:unnamed protein product [Rotaria sordida]|uniref:Sodium-coupled monocarboxylate transporter 2 n=1 Tax=Rotaria sordida TaxID=392033 RepID=A0A815FPC3_9BILA|nr:unnamed protein product [Rotaria sordida]
MAIVLYAPALALSQTTGLNVWLSVVSIGVICTFYSSVGGLKAIIWTDVIQAVVMFIGLFAVIIQGLVTLGGWKRTFARASRGGRIELDSISFDPRTRHTIWSLLIGGFFNSFATFAFNQAQIQRYMCIHSTRGAKQALLINAVGSGILILLSVFIGIIVYAYYADCDPYTAKQIQEIDQILPYFVMEVLSDKKGLPGVFLACVFSGSLSTISSGLNSLAAVIIEDFYKGLMGRKLTDQRQGFIAKILSVILGVCVMLLTYVVSHLGSILSAALSIFGVLEGPNMGVFILGFLFPQANRRGALAGFITSLALQLWIFLGAQFTKKQRKSFSLPLSIAKCTNVTNSTLEETTTTWTLTSTIPTALKRDPFIDLYSVSYIWYSAIAVSTVVLVGIIVSYLTRSLESEEIDPKLIIPISDVCYCLLPKQWRKRHECGIEDEAYRKKQDNTNNFDMNIYSTNSSGRTNLIVPIFDMNSKVLVQSNVVAPAPNVFLQSVPSIVDGTDDNQSENRKSGLHRVSF